MAFKITSLTIVYSTIYSSADQRKYQSSASLAFMRGIHRSPVNSPHKGQVTRKMFTFDDVIVDTSGLILCLCPANYRRCYFVTTSLIGWAQAYNEPYAFNILVATGIYMCVTVTKLLLASVS